MSKTVSILSSNTLKIEFPYSEAMVEQVKTLSGRKWHSIEKYWSAPISTSNITKLKQLEFEIPKELMSMTELTHISSRVDGIQLLRELYPFQKEGVAFIEKMGGRALVSDEMGLGKTIQALAWTQLHSELRPVVILCPAHLKRNWEHEIKITLPEETYIDILEGKKSRYLSMVAFMKGFVIVNYDILDAWIEEIKASKPKILIIDESHYIKNGKTNRTKVTQQLASEIPHVIALTGTPITNRPIEAFSILKAVNPDIFPDFLRYGKRYCDAYQYNGKWRFDGASNTKELHSILTQNVMIRRKKKDVLKELPDKIYTHIEVEIDNRREYQEAEEEFLDYMRKSKGIEAAMRARRAEVLVKIENLKQLAAHGKIKQTIGWIEDFLESGEKLVVYATHREVIDAIATHKEFKDICVKIDGGTFLEERHQRVRAFQEDPKIKLFVGSIKAAGTGLTLTAASNVLFVELPWTPGDLSQAEDRCHRIGQKDVVNVYSILAEKTIDIRIWNIISRKREIIASVVDGTQPDIKEENIIRQILSQYGVSDTETKSTSNINNNINNNSTTILENKQLIQIPKTTSKRRRKHSEVWVDFDNL